MSTTVIIYSQSGEKLGETSRCGHIRKLLDTKQAVVVSNNPFSIRLQYDHTSTEGKSMTGGAIHE